MAHLLPSNHGRWRRGHAWRIRLWGSLRVLTYCAFVSLSFSVLSLHAVYGEVRDAAFSLGREMAQLADVLGPAQPVVLNGTTMFVGARHVEMSVREVLDRFETYCSENAGGFEEEFAKVPLETRNLLPEYLRDAGHFATVRQEVDDEGMLSCVAAPRGAKGLRALLVRAQEFAETGDLGRIGKLRYVFARANAKAGGADIVTLWHDGSFNVLRMLFSDGDVPGRDTEGMPRPAGAVRILSAEVPGTGYGLRVFEARQSATEILKRYDDELSALGWTSQPFPNEPEARDVLADSSRAFIRDSAVVFLSAATEADRTIVTMAEMGTRGNLTVEAVAPHQPPHNEDDPPRRERPALR